MKIMRKLMNLLFIVVLFMAFNTCTEDNPVYERSVWLGPTANGSLKIFVRYNMTYFGAGAVVQLFKTSADRDVGNVYIETGCTSHGAGATDQYAIIINLDYAKYYLKGTYDETSTGRYYVGYEENKSGIWVPKGTETSVHIMTDFQ